jgi:putative flippase GtrA
MISLEHIRAISPRAAEVIAPHYDFARKAISFALIGIINVAIDTSVFLFVHWYLNADAAALRRLDAFAALCGCARPHTLLLILANVAAWVVAVSGSYAMNSFVTFAAESGRSLRWRAYWTFVASGVLGEVAGTAMLVVAARFMPVLAAKGCGVLAGFVVNFSMSHFVVFRRRPAVADIAPGE